MNIYNKFFSADKPIIAIFHILWKNITIYQQDMNM